MPSRRQPDLFEAGGFSPASVQPPLPPTTPVIANDLDDPQLIAAIPHASVATYQDLIEKAVRRRPDGAIAALEALCRRFRGFGLRSVVPEQAAAIQALAAIGGRDATLAVTRTIVDQVVQGPGLVDTLRTASELGCRLPATTALPLLRHPDPAVRTGAARCVAQPAADVIAALLDLLDDLHENVVAAAACALGRAGRTEARPVLLRLLRRKLSAEVIAALAAVADQTCIVLLGRIARTSREYADHALAALREIDDDQAAALLATLSLAHGPPTPEAAGDLRGPTPAPD